MTATTRSVTGNVKDVFTTSLGWLIFGGFKSTRLSLAGLAVSFVGAGMYSLSSLRKGQAGGAQKAPPTAAAPNAATAGSGAQLKGPHEGTGASISRSRSRSSSKSSGSSSSSSSALAATPAPRAAGGGGAGLQSTPDEESRGGSGLRSRAASAASTGRGANAAASSESPFGVAGGAAARVAAQLLQKHRD